MTSTQILISLIQRSCPDLSIFNYEEQTGFERLWTALDDETSALGDQIVILWGGTWIDSTVAPVDTAKQVTPFDWAACAAAVWPSTQVCVIDLQAAAHRHAPAVELLDRLTKGRRLDWIHVLGFKNLADLAPAASNDAIRQSMFPDARANDAPALLDAFFLLRRHALTDPDPSGDRHSITNIIGPLVLLGRTPGELSGHTKALWHLLKSSGLVRAQEGDSVSETLQPTVLEPLSPVRVVLLDDQWHQGWAEWVSQRLGLPWDEARVENVRAAALRAPQRLTGGEETGVSLWVAGAPGWLLERIEAAVDERGPDARFRLRLTDGDDGVSEILLLDLRLFQAGSGAERAFMASAQEFARRFVKRGVWPVFTNEELDRVKEWSSSSSDEDVDRPTALTLLARLVAHVDLALPIVLFSSTGRREVVGKLRGYESVNTRFAKPRFFGDSTSTADDASASFNEAIREASVLLAGRRTVVTCLAAEEYAKRVVPAQTYGHAALYLDESETETAFTVGGVLALYKDESDERRFDRRLKDEGIHWATGGKQKYVAAGKGTEPDWCNRIAELARLDGIKLVGAALTANRTDSNDIVASRVGAAGTPRSLDRLHRTMLRTIIEVALFHLIRDEEMAKQWTCGILADVRSIPAKSLDASAQEEVREKFGLYAGVFSRWARELEAKREVLLASRKAGKEDLANSLEKWCQEDLQSRGGSSVEQTAGDVSGDIDRTLRRQRMLGFIGGCPARC